MSTYLQYLTRSDVSDARTFAAFAHQTLGTPEPSQKDMALLYKKLNEFFLATPQASWLTLARTVEWCRAKKRRPATAWGVLASTRWAWADGMLPELDPQRPVNPNVEYAISHILESEVDADWRARLIGATGMENRSAALRSYRQAHEVLA